MAELRQRVIGVIRRASLYGKAAPEIADAAIAECFKWTRVKDEEPVRTEPIVYARRRGQRWSVGIAYWTVSGKWNPEMGARLDPDGFTHWTPLFPPPEGEAG